MTTFRQTRLRRNLKLRSQIIQTIRVFFLQRGFLEVETPYRIPAPAPEAHIDAEPSGDWFMHTSPELCMKRLLAAGYPQIFQIGKCFRQGERGRLHVSEFTMLEWYWAQHDYMAMMGQVEELICFVAHRTGFGDSLSYQEKQIDLKQPWPRMTVAEAFEVFAPIGWEEALAANRFEECMVDHLEPKLNPGKPMFLYDYPSALGSLARLKTDNPAFAERFELYIGGLEICNAFSELIDPHEQRERFEAQMRLRRQAGQAVYPMPEKFLEALQFMPQVSGSALGIDRLVMLFADAGKIDDVIAFTPEEL